MSSCEVKTILRPKHGQTQTISRSKLTTIKRPGQKEQAFASIAGSKSKRIGGKNEESGKRKHGRKGSGDHEESEGGQEQFLEAKRLEIEKSTKARSRAPGAHELDTHTRIGPDVVSNYIECTPLLLWFHKKTSLVNFTNLMEKDSEEIVPMSPREIDETESELFRTAKGTTPPMSWTANLTALEEEEFISEGPLIDNVKLADSIPLEAEDIDKFAIQIVRVKDIKTGAVELKERVRAILTESDTIFLNEQTGKLIFESNADIFMKIEANNSRYRKLCETILVSDAYVDRSSQTFSERERDKSTQAKGVGVTDQGNYCNKYLMLDEFNRVKKMELKKRLKDEEDTLMRALADRARDDMYEEAVEEGSDKSSDAEDDTELRHSSIDWTRLEEEEEEEEEEPPNDISDEELDVTSEDEFEVDIELDDVYQLRVERETKIKPKILPDITMEIALLDRLVSTNRLQPKHVEARGFENPFKRFVTRLTSSKAAASLALSRAAALVEGGTKLTRFWSYTANLTKGKEVTCIEPHPTNGNLVAAAYGSNNFASTIEGIVCIWNLKNVNYPERVFPFHTSVTAIAFSKLTSYLLAIALLDGNVVLYDIRQPNPQAVCSTLKSIGKHHGPIWDVTWLQETEMATTGTVSEVLVTLSDDGYLYRWSSSKGFDPSVMLKIRRSALKIPGRRERRAEALISQLSASYTICFYPNDYTQYLIGTEEGFIHKATVSYTEQYVRTYIGHTGPVYKIRFSPFAKDIFISCGGDWCVKIWKEDQPNALITFCTGLRTIFDVAWAPTISSVFICTSEVFIEVWDVTINTLEPIIQYKPPFSVGLRRVMFWDYLQAVILGDDDGGLTVYSLRNFPVQPIQLDDQIDNLLEAIIAGYKKRRPKIEDFDESDSDQVDGQLSPTPSSMVSIKGRESQQLNESDTGRPNPGSTIPSITVG